MEVYSDTKQGRSGLSIMGVACWAFIGAVCMILDCSLGAQKKILSTFKLLHTMSDYGYDFSCYLLSLPTVGENICFLRRNTLSSLVFAGSCHGAEILDLKPLQSAPPPRISGGPEGSSHMLTDKCILVLWLSDHSFSPSCLMRTTPSSDPTEPPSRGQ